MSYVAPLREMRFVAAGTGPTCGNCRAAVFEEGPTIRWNAVAEGNARGSPPK